MEMDITPVGLERLSHELRLGEMHQAVESKGPSAEDPDHSPSHVRPNVYEFQRPDRPPEYFAVDIDGTFFIKDEKLFAKNVNAFKGMRNMGHQPFFCTARPFQSLPYIFGPGFFKATGYRGFPGIYLNGGVVYDKDGKLVSATTFSRTFTEEMLLHIESRGLESSFVFWTVHGHYSLDRLNDSVNFIIKGEGLPDPEIKEAAEILDMEILSVVTCAPKFDMERSTFGHDYSIRNVGLEYLIEYCPLGVTKADGISLLMRHVGLEPGSCGFIGDGDNDVESMELCDISFAVGNATNFVKRHAKWILHLNYYDGAFAYAMNLLYRTNHF